MKSFDFKKRSTGSHAAKHSLTPLVDCFAIILIYLLMASSFGSEEFKVPEGMKLPKASEAQVTDNMVIVVVKNQTYSMGGKTYSIPALIAEFKKIPEKKAIIIQADKNLSFGEINPVVTAGLQSGFSEVQFAVSKEEKM